MKRRIIALLLALMTVLGVFPVTALAAATVPDALGVELNAYNVSSEFLAAAGVPYGYDFEGSLIGDKAVSVVFDNSKLKRVVPDMQTTVRFDQGVQIALDYILAHPEECQRPDPAFDAWCDRVIDVLERAKREMADGGK